MNQRIQQWVATAFTAAMFLGIIFLLATKFLERM